MARVLLTLGSVLPGFYSIIKFLGMWKTAIEVKEAQRVAVPPSAP